MKMTGGIFNLNKGAKLFMVVTIMAFSKTAIGQCSNLFTHSAAPQGCGEFLGFVVSPQPAADSIVFNYGNGEILTTVGITGSAFYNGGSYEVEVTAYHNNGCISTSSQWITVSGLQLSMNEDTVVCQSDFIFDPLVSGGSGNYSYQWTPTLGLDDPTILNPTLSVNIEQEAYYFTVTDQLNGCQAIDTIIVTRNAPLIETYSLCAGSVTIDLGPGALSYEWLSFTDTAGNNTPLSYSNTTQAIVVNDPGEYFAYAIFSECGPLTSLIVLESCVQGCANTFTYTETSGNCGAEYLFAGTAGQAVVDWYWDFGDGSTSTLESPSHVFLAGTYQVSLSTVDFSGCQATSSSTINANGGFVEVDILNDSVACGGDIWLSALVTGGTGAYTYNWFVDGLSFSGSTMPNPTVDPITEPTEIAVFVGDSTNNCFGIDTAMVYPNIAINETIELCNGTAILEVPAFSQVYSWTYTDTIGNSTNLVNGDHFITVDNLGTYACMSYTSGCDQVVHEFQVIACGEGCANTFTYTETFGNCGAEHLFAGTADQTVVDWYWDFGDGATATVQSPNHVFLGGTYQVSLTTVDINGCQATSTSALNTNGGFGVELVQDSVACNGIYFPNYTTSGGSGNYTYNWTPEALMDDPTAANPVMTVSYDTWVEVILTDIQLGCTSVDSMYIYANLPINETLTLCDDSLYLEVNPGSQGYQWSYTDEFGNTTQIQDFDYDLWATQEGTYACFTYLSQCNPTTHTFSVEPCEGSNDEVWPGDANSDNIVTNADALYLGLAFNQTGPVRPSATLNWAGQPCPDWTFNFAVNNVNLKHADCDGNGIVNFDDTLAIDFNYLNTHNKFEAAPVGGNPPIWIEATPDTVGLEHAIDIVVHLGTVAEPVTDLHGVAFSLTFDETLVQSQGLSIDFDNCVLGTAGVDVLTFQETMFLDGAIDIAVTRNTLVDFQGYGPIVHARIVTTDNLSGYADLPIGVSAITALSSMEEEVLLTAIPDTVVIDPNKVGIVEPEQLDVSVYPNPSNGMVTIEGITEQTKVSVMNSIGQAVFRTSLESGKTRLDLSHLNNGIYILKLETDKAVGVERLRLIR